MNDEHSEDLTREERRAFEALADPVSPPPGCETRIVEALRERDLIRSDAPAGGPLRTGILRRLFSPLPKVAFATAALAAAFLLGAQYGKRSAEPEPPAALLEEPFLPDKGEKELYGGGDDEMLALLERPSPPSRPERSPPEEPLRKPVIDPRSDPDFGEFPPYPLDGTSRAISPKYR
jgi:hypothetical protein